MVESTTGVSMTLTILDPRSGHEVTLWVEDVPTVQQAALAKIVTHPRFVARRSS
jgi:hypothetical protein